CRALGIPSRVVSNLVSAHDANKSLTVDKYYTETMEELDFDPNNPSGADSIWNYHVWNDVWMARPDLPPGYGGWQAIDATPQETSSGMFQCGPASLEAIKQGVIGVGYDVEFMLASVNADLMRWRHDPEAETGYSMVDSNNFHIGRMVLTKKPYIFDPLGDEDREDITAQYKHREGTASERLALMNGVRYSERAKRYYAVASTLKSDVKFNLRDIDAVMIGKEFRVTVDVQNDAEEGRNIKASLTATSVFYNGVKSDLIKKVEGKIFVGPQKKEQISILVTADDYLPKLVEYCNMKISAMAIVDETKQSWADDDDFQVLKPNITIKFNDDLIIDQPATAVLSFPNPLDRSLSGCEFRVTSSGIAGRTLRIAASDVGPKGVVTAELPVQPNKLGKINFVATFKSVELKDITGAASVEVYEG
ncbi:hemocyte protein-glutamine gamma-glutamyltransferase-like, partial [Ostrinia furnacalis]|uniref:hemocyte protein-glutamine gamma-glutamyltransferase-like n=1 Tax=Ostrinia furnacalis TaxID=93504 RepID=UPI001040ADEE